MKRLLLNLSWQLFTCVTFLAFAFEQELYSMARSSSPSPVGKCDVSGTILDAETSNPMPGAKVSIYKSTDSSLVTGGITDNSGKFHISQVPGGDYYVSVNFIGYQPYNLKNLSIDGSKESLDIGALKIIPGSITTSEVNIDAEKEAAINSVDKKIFNVEKNLAAAGGSALDVMHSIPNVIVDTDGNITIRGSSGVKILVDGKPSQQSSSEILQQIPASAIERVELITNPSAKYDAEGSSGIINIVLKKKTTDGLNALLSMSAGTEDKYNTSLNGNYKIDDLNFFFSADTRFYRFGGTGTLNFRSMPFDSMSILNEKSNITRRGYYYNLKGGADYLFNDFNSLTLSAMYVRGFHTGDEYKHQNYFSPDNSLLSYHFRDNMEEHDHVWQEYSLSYKKKFEEKCHELTADAALSLMDNNEAFNTSDINYQNNLNEITIPPLLQNTMAIRPVTTLSVQSDYVRPFSDGSRLEAGVKNLYRNNHLDYSFYTLDNHNSRWVYDSTYSNIFTYYENIAAAYLTYSGSFGSLIYQAGLRVEQTNTDAFLETKDKHNKYSYLDLFPSIFLKYQFSPVHSLNLSYSRRITRPDVRLINPSDQYADSRSVVYGNPALKPEYFNSLELSHSVIWEKTSLLSTVFYRQIEDLISFVFYLDNKINYMTYANMNTNGSYGLEFTVAREIIKGWKVDINYSCYRSDITGQYDGMMFNTKNFSWNGRLNTYINLFNILDVQFSANYTSPQLTPQGTFNGNFFADCGMKADLLDGKASISFRVTDIFNTMQFGISNSEDNFSLSSSNRRATRTAYLGFTYKFNDYKRRQERRRDSGNGIDELG